MNRSEAPRGCSGSKSRGHRNQSVLNIARLCFTLHGSAPSYYASIRDTVSGRLLFSCHQTDNLDRWELQQGQRGLGWLHSGLTLTLCECVRPIKHVHLVVTLFNCSTNQSFQFLPSGQIKTDSHLRAGLHIGVHCSAGEEIEERARPGTFIPSCSFSPSLPQLVLIKNLINRKSCERTLCIYLPLVLILLRGEDEQSGS